MAAEKATAPFSVDIGPDRTTAVAVLATLVYVALVMFVVHTHEPWCDEAHSWVLVRDVGLWKTITTYLHYEGAPPLWHIFIRFLFALHVPYAGFNYASALVAIGGAYFVFRYAPFPWFIRLLLPFTYFFGYQYAVIARNYVFLPLLAFLAAHLLPSAKSHPLRFAIVLILLANVSAHGTLMACGFAVIHLMALQDSLGRLDSKDRRMHLLAAGLFVVALVITVALAYPAIDSVGIGMMDRSLIRKLRDVVVGFSGSLFEFLPCSAIVLFILTWWCFRQGAGDAFLVLVLPMGFFYGLIYRNTYHQGTITVALVATCWIARVRDRRPYAKPRRQVVAAMALAAMITQIYWTGAAVYHDYWETYSAGGEAANYIRPLAAQGKTIYGFDFRSVAILPYLDKNPFLNQTRVGPVWVQSIPWRDRVNSIPRILNEAPEYIVVGIQDRKTTLAAEQFRRNGYYLWVLAKGALIWKESYQQEESFAILKRIDPYTPPKGKLK